MKLGKSDLIFYVNYSIIISIKRIGGGFMYKEMPRMFLRLDQEEWKAGYKLGFSLEDRQPEAFCKGKSEAFCNGYIAGQKAKEEGNN